LHKFVHDTLLEIRGWLNSELRLDEADGCLNGGVFAGTTVACRQMGFNFTQLLGRLTIEKVHQTLLNFPTSHRAPASRSSSFRIFCIPYLKRDFTVGTEQPTLRATASKGSSP
jgi:hypothetical protein